MANKSRESIKDKDQGNSKVNDTLLKRNRITLWLSEMAGSESPLEEAKEEVEALYSEYGGLLISVLIKSLEDKDIGIRNTAVWALGALGSKDAIPHLRKILSDPRKSILAKAAAVAGLQELGEDVDLSEVTVKDSKSVRENLMEHFLLLLQDDSYADMLFNEFFKFPLDFQIWLVHELGKSQEKKVVNFLASIAEDAEVNPEVEGTIRASLDKLREKGVNPDSLPSRLGLETYHKAWASQSRDEGKVSLFIGWERPGGDLKVLAFLLDFLGDGIVDFFVINDMAKEEFEGGFFSTVEEEEGESEPSPSPFVEVNLGNAIYLVQKAFNDSYEAVCPVEFRRYSFLLDIEVPISDDEVSRLTCHLVRDLHLPERVIEVFYRALENFDFGLAYDLLSVKSRERCNMGRDEYLLKCENASMDCSEGDFVAFSILKRGERRGKSTHTLHMEVDLIRGGGDEKTVSLIREDLTLRREDGIWKLFKREERWRFPIQDDSVVFFLTEGSEDGRLFSAIYQITGETDEGVQERLKGSPYIRTEKGKGSHLQFVILSNGPASEEQGMGAGVALVAEAKLYLFSWMKEDFDYARGVIDELLGPYLNIIAVDDFVFLRDNKSNDETSPPRMTAEVAKESILKEWLVTPMPALDGLAPVDALENVEGRERLRRILRQAIIYQDLLEERGFNPIIDYRELFTALGL